MSIKIANISHSQNIAIGNVVLPGCAFLAPMAGISDAPFRSLAARFGAAMAVSEMIASAGLLTGAKDVVRKLGPCGSLPHMVQLSGFQEQWMVRGAQMAVAAGAQIIDINLGCPSKRVTNGYAGSALMRVPDKALKLIEAVARAVNVPVTVKMRLGWDENSLNAAAIANSAQSAGVKMFVVHGRTRQQFYKGKARWQLVSEVVKAVNVPVIVNGDIVDINSADKALAASGAAGVMVGRAAQGRPWLVGQINAHLLALPVSPAPQGNALGVLVGEHYQAMLKSYGDELGVRVARKHLRWYLEAAGVKMPKNLLTQKDPARVVEMIAGAFSSPVRVAA
ncbi:tRNA-dihydrouridine synthase DusB [hydrothermal vent metagenome]|uniref:tRNA-dihydrouridine synthase DusB n=1 Tax=hydrothermal vent metagenome TaxID=652676 RepID=A0A3B0TFE0_9ZZZZ